jgi:RNA polymerase sigma-70 factor, ECF subfamily
MTGDAASTFEPYRDELVGVAYRLLGSIAEAEDAVQDAFLRWQATDRTGVETPRAYLRRVVARLALDRLKSARVRREHYVGTWLPEPIVEDVAETTMADDLSVALLMTLERLSALERAAFLLHDVFDMDYDAIAEIIERSEAACRQLAARARAHVRAKRPRFTVSREAETRLAKAFAAAMFSGDVASLATLLAEDAVFYSDGGGKRHAALKPIYGRERILRFVAGVSRLRTIPTPETTHPVRINGLPGFVLHDSEGVETVAIETCGELIVAIYTIRNPDKLRHLQ